MATSTIEVPDELSVQLAQLGDRLPDLLRHCLQQSVVPAHVYRYILDFLTNQPTPEQIAAFRHTSEVQERLRSLLAKSQGEDLTPDERRELDGYEYEWIEHLIIMLKLGNLSYLIASWLHINRVEAIALVQCFTTHLCKAVLRT